MLDKGTIERAFELAGSGEARSIDDVSRQLRREQYEGVALHLRGPFVRRQLRELIYRSRVDDFSLEVPEAESGPSTDRGAALRTATVDRSRW